MIADERVILEEADERRWRWHHALLGALVAAMAVMWVYAIFFAPKENRNRLDDRAWADRNEATCAASLAEILQLTPAAKSKTPQDRAVVLDSANAMVDELVRDLKANTPTGTDKELNYVRLWLDDYTNYAKARHDYADVLRTGKDAQFAVKMSDGGPIDNRIDAFAIANSMPSCRVPGDV